MTQQAATDQEYLIPGEIARAAVLPASYLDEEKTVYPAYAWLRANNPLGLARLEGFDPIWLVSKHADIMEIERANDVFTNSPRPVLATAEGDEQQAAIGVSTLIHMDDPEHRGVRAIGADWFRPKAMPRGPESGSTPRPGSRALFPAPRCGRRRR